MRQNKFNRSKQIPNIHKDDGSILPIDDAEKIALERHSFESGWRSNTYSSSPKNNPTDKGFDIKNRFNRMKQFVKMRTGGVLGYFTAPPEGTSQPTDQEIAIAAKKIGLEHYAPELVRCFHDIIAGGRFMPPSMWLDQLRKKKMNVSQAQKHLTGLVRTIKAINYEKIPGRTPLEKSVATLKLLGRIDREACEDDGSDNGNFAGSSVNDVGFYANEAKQENAIKKLNLALEEVSKLDEMECLLLGGKLAGTLHNQTLEITVDLIESLLRDNQAKFIMKVARILDKLPKLKIEGEHTIQKDTHGIDVRARQMEDLNELPKINKASWSLFQEHPELFWSKAMNREFMVREHISKKSQKQILYMLVDSSGSMNGGRIQLALAVLLNRLKGVIDGEATLQYRFFDNGVYGEHTASNAFEAKKALEILRKNNYSGGGTDISNALLQGVKSIINKQSKEGGVKPHLAIVTDGCDEININYNALQGVILHAFIVGGENAALCRLAKQSGGLAIILDHNGKVDVQ